MVTARRGRRARRRPLSAFSDGCGSKDKGRGGAPLTASFREVRHSVAGRSTTRGRSSCSCRRPQVCAPLSPRCSRGERFCFIPGIAPPPPLVLHRCSGAAQEGSDTPPAPPPLSCGPSPCGARLLGGHPESWPDHAPPPGILSFE
ncbi:hypothetical protein NDU88_004295 [Pleurodeles waltl]|uniref:Uncharacterized protein n=1 Tax=Pleurodeles waltl TaxID=8319 RepID=A0AAV7LQI5_PLEWA|nr:hypothetical protein NDU88_004295 [Pleurodeles waltl]